MSDVYSRLGISDYLNAINALNPKNVGLVPDGYSLLFSSATNPSYAENGLSAAAYANPTTGQIIVAYLGPNTVSGSGEIVLR